MPMEKRVSGNIPQSHASCCKTIFSMSTCSNAAMKKYHIVEGYGIEGFTKDDFTRAILKGKFNIDEVNPMQQIAKVSEDMMRKLRDYLKTSTMCYQDKKLMWFAFSLLFYATL